MGLIRIDILLLNVRCRLFYVYVSLKGGGEVWKVSYLKIYSYRSNSVNKFPSAANVGTYPLQHVINSMSIYLLEPFFVV